MVEILRISEEKDPFSDTDENNEDDERKEENNGVKRSELISKLQGKDDDCEVSDLASACADLVVDP